MKKRAFQGFTLIELMVVTAMIIILSGTSLSAYLNFNVKQSLINDARALTRELSRAKTEAGSLQYPTGCTSFRGINFKSITVNGTLSGIQITRLCDPINVTEEPVKILSSSVFNAAFDITFIPGTGYLSGGQELNIVISHEADQTQTKTIYISALGVSQAL